MGNNEPKFELEDGLAAIYNTHNGDRLQLSLKSGSEEPRALLNDVEISLENYTV
jgi:hypothetical protein